MPLLRSVRRLLPAHPRSNTTTANMAARLGLGAFTAGCARSAHRLRILLFFVSLPKRDRFRLRKRCHDLAPVLLDLPHFQAIFCST